MHDISCMIHASYELSSKQLSRLLKFKKLLLHISLKKILLRNIIKKCLKKFDIFRLLYYREIYMSEQLYNNFQLCKVDQPGI